MIRWYVLKFLGESGLTLDKQRVAAVRKDEVRAQRAPIRWLTKAQAVQVARKLAQPWKDLFRVQMGLALRPSELVTLKRGDFDPHCRRVTLSPLGVFTLKEGSRTIRVPVPTRRVLQRRLKAGEIVFPCGSLHVFYRSFRTALRAAAVAAGVLTPMDCRIARRTATTLLLADGVPLKTVADITGDDVGTLMEHYAGVVPGGVLATAAAI